MGDNASDCSYDDDDDDSLAARFGGKVGEGGCEGGHDGDNNGAS